MIKKVGILTNGGDCPGLNAVIRAVVRTALRNGVECYGYIEGYKGLLENNYVNLTKKYTSGIINKDGTIIGSSNKTNVFNYPVEEDGKIIYKDLSDVCIENMKKEGVECLFTIGGDGTQKSARDFKLKGVNVIGIPKTIDNDVKHTDVTFGFNTAVQTATDAIDRLHTTAESHHRVLTLEVMGRYTGWIALESGISGGADAVLIPEIPYDINKVADKIKERIKQGRRFSIVVVAEGAKPLGGEVTVKRTMAGGKGLDNTRLGGIGEKVAHELEQLTGLEARNTTLGYVQRGGTPTSFDRVLATKYGYKAMELALDGIFNVLVTLDGGKLSYVSLEEVVGENKKIGAASGEASMSSLKKIEMDDDLVKTARALGISLGD